MRGKQNWEHLQEELHVVIEVEDTPTRAQVKLEKAKEEINKLLIPVVGISAMLAIFTVCIRFKGQTIIHVICFAFKNFKSLRKMMTLNVSNWKI